MTFFILGTTVWVMKAMLYLIEGGLMSRILGNMAIAQGDQDKVSQENAKQIVKNIRSFNSRGYFIKLFIIHMLPFFHLSMITAGMMFFVHIPLNGYALSNSIVLYYQVFFEDIKDRIDYALVRFPRKTVYEVEIFGPSGTVEKKDIICFHGNSNTLEISWCFQIIMIQIVLIAMVLDKLIMSIFFVLYATNDKHKRYGKKYLRKFDYFALYLIQKNVSPNLMDDIFVELHKSAKNDKTFV